MFWFFFFPRFLQSLGSRGEKVCEPHPEFPSAAAHLSLTVGQSSAGIQNFNERQQKKEREMNTPKWTGTKVLHNWRVGHGREREACFGITAPGSQAHSLYVIQRYHTAFWGPLIPPDNQSPGSLQGRVTSSSHRHHKSKVTPGSDALESPPA